MLPGVIPLNLCSLCLKAHCYSRRRCTELEPINVTQKIVPVKTSSLRQTLIDMENIYTPLISHRHTDAQQKKQTDHWCRSNKSLWTCPPASVTPPRDVELRGTHLRAETLISWPHTLPPWGMSAPRRQLCLPPAHTKRKGWGLRKQFLMRMILWRHLVKIMQHDLLHVHETWAVFGINSPCHKMCPLFLCSHLHAQTPKGEKSPKQFHQHIQALTCVSPSSRWYGGVRGPVADGHLPQREERGDEQPAGRGQHGRGLLHARGCHGPGIAHLHLRALVLLAAALLLHGRVHREARVHLLH